MMWTSQDLNFNSSDHKNNIKNFLSSGTKDKNGTSTHRPKTIKNFETPVKPKSRQLNTIVKTEAKSIRPKQLSPLNINKMAAYNPLKDK